MQDDNNNPYILQPKELNLATMVFDDKTGYDIYKQTIDILRQHYTRPNFRGLVISTEAMKSTFIEGRNVVGRLLAISMAINDVYLNGQQQSTTTKEEGDDKRIISKNQDDFENAYLSLCEQLFSTSSSISSTMPNDSFCQLLGGTVTIQTDSNFPRNLIMSDSIYKDQYKEMWNDFRHEMCDRLTETVDNFQLQNVALPVKESIHDVAFARFWQGLNENDAYFPRGPEDTSHEESTDDNEIDEESMITIKPKLAHKSFVISEVPYRGIIVDLVDTLIGPDELRRVMELMVRLGMNTIQLSLMNKLGCVLQLKDLKQLYYLVPNQIHADPLTDSDLIKIVRYASKLGIEVIPEISITTQAAGWYHAGFLVQCPKSLCETGEIANDVTRGPLLPIILEVIRELHTIFNNNQSGFLHLGSDERNATKSCWKESGQVPNYDLFESKLTELLLDKEWYHPSKMLRWENQEGVVYPNRTGDLTHYQYSIPKETGSFSSIKIDSDSDTWTVYYQIRELVESKPQGVLVKVSLTELHKNVRNLIAVSLALSSSDIPPMKDSSALDSYISEICNEDAGLCSSFSSINVGRSITDSQQRKHHLCKSMTKVSTDRQMKR